MKTSFLRRVITIGLVVVPASWGRAQSIAASQEHACVIDVAGQLYCWGKGTWKQPSLIRYDSTPMPLVDSTRRFAAIAVGWLHDCALTVDGQVRCAGVGLSGELGRNPNRKCEFCGRPDTIASPLRFRNVVTGQLHTCAVTLDRRAYCWGDNGTGAVGTGDRVPKISWPTSVIGGHRWLSLVAGDRHTCGITTEQRIFCWGANSFGELGSNHLRRGCQEVDPCLAVPWPIDDTTRFVSIAAGGDKTCGVTALGELYCWGRGYTAIKDTMPLKPRLIRTSFAVASVTLGPEFTCALGVGGRAYCWRDLSNGGVVGTPTLGRCTRADTLCVLDIPVNTPLRFTALAAGDEYVCGIATDGAVYCWGILDLTAWSPSCRVKGACSTVPVRIGGTLNLLNPRTTANAKR